MAKSWVLETATKGTGAHVAPFSEKPKERTDRPLAIVQLERPPRPQYEHEEPEPVRSFKLVDVRSGSVLGEHLDTRKAVAGLSRMPSALDARVYIWEQQRGRWRLLDLAQTRALWELAQRAEAAGAGA